MRKYNLAVVIGRFQGFHNGHRYLLERAFSIAEKVLVLVGSARAAPSVNNPFSFEERKEMIQLGTQGFLRFKQKCDNRASEIKETEPCNIPESNLAIEPLRDFLGNDELWLEEVQRIVDKHIINKERIVVVGHKKDHTSYYLDYFNMWPFEEVDFHAELHATDIREMIYKNEWTEVAKHIPYEVTKYLIILNVKGKFVSLREDYQMIEAYDPSIFPNTFVTADAVVIQQGHVLMIRRKFSPGKGLLALPGGFVKPNQRVLEAMIAELREETGLKVPEKVIRGSIECNKYYDSPPRDLRARIVTIAFLVHLTYVEQGLPKVKGGDDAAEAMWIPISQIREEECYSDHYHIIHDLIGRIR